MSCFLNGINLAMHLSYLKFYNKQNYVGLSFMLGQKIKIVELGGKV